MRYWLSLFLGFSIGWGIMALINGKAYPADLPIPKPRPAPEMCVGPDVKPTTGQTLQADATCPGGYRWKVQK